MINFQRVQEIEDCYNKKSKKSLVKVRRESAELMEIDILGSTPQFKQFILQNNLGTRMTANEESRRKPSARHSRPGSLEGCSDSSDARRIQDEALLFIDYVKLLKARTFHVIS